MLVDVQEYNPAWPRIFEEIKQDLATTLHDISYIGIEHVGSTAVPGLAAKPIIDIDIIVNDGQVERVTSALATRKGWTYMGEWGVKGRHAFRKPKTDPRYNTYVCVEGCQALRNHLSIRDLCRRDPEARKKYGELKVALSQREWIDLDEYCEAKSELLSAMLQEAGMKQEEVDEIEVMCRRTG